MGQLSGRPSKDVAGEIIPTVGIISGRPARDESDPLVPTVGTSGDGTKSIDIIAEKYGVGLGVVNARIYPRECGDLLTERAA